MKVKELAYALGISESMAHRLKKRGMPVHSIAAAESWRTKHLDGTRTKQHRLDGNTGRKGGDHGSGQLCNKSEGRSASEGGTVSDLVAERTRLAKEQADKVAMENAVRRGELAPASLIADVLARAAAKIAGIFDGIPGLVHRRVPGLTAVEIDMIRGEITKARNIVASMSLADLYDDESPHDPESAAAG